MKIEIKNHGIQFGKVPVGSLFAFPAHSYSDTDIYMVVEEHCVRNDKINAVCLWDGALHVFSEDDDVRLLDNAKLVIG